jgi:hypothetical protein
MPSLQVSDIQLYCFINGTRKVNVDAADKKHTRQAYNITCKTSSIAKPRYEAVLRSITFGSHAYKRTPISGHPSSLSPRKG